MQVKNPEFEGQTKTRLGNPEVRKIVDGIITSVSPLSWKPAAKIQLQAFLQCFQVNHTDDIEAY